MSRVHDLRARGGRRSRGSCPMSPGCANGFQHSSRAVACSAETVFRHGKPLPYGKPSLLGRLPLNARNHGRTPRNLAGLLTGNSIPGSASSQHLREPRSPSPPTDLAVPQDNTKPIPRPSSHLPQFITNSLRIAPGTPKRPREKRTQGPPSTFPRRSQLLRPPEKLALNFTLSSQDEPNPGESNSRTTGPQSHTIVEIRRPKPSFRRATACSNGRFFRQGKTLPSRNAGIRGRTHGSPEESDLSD
jgi:hypothetical protein